MRQRLVAAFVGLTVLLLLLYAVPRGYFLAELVRSDEQIRVDRTALALATVVDQRLAEDQPVTADFLRTLSDTGEQISYRNASGELVSSTGTSQQRDGQVSGSHDVAAGGEVTVARTASAVREQVRKALASLAVLGLLLVLFAGLAGFVLARRMARPFQELAVAARGLGLGRFHPEIPRYPVPEARAIGEALTDAGHQLEVLIARERDVAVHASHALRTPVTALRLELEDLALWPETPPVVAGALRRGVGELDRLSTAITDLLDLSETSRLEQAADVDLNALAEDVARALREEGVHVVNERGVPTPTRLDPRPVAAIVEVLVLQALGAGDRAVRLNVVSRGTHDEVRVTGSGDGPSRRADSGGLSEAAELAAGIGGRISRDGPTLVLRLPRGEPQGTGSTLKPAGPARR